jgi:hypothetical protein
MDVKRAQLKVLREALDTLWRFKPTVAVEVRGWNREEFLGLMNSFDYR